MAPTVLFLHNDPIATEAMLGNAFADAGFDVSTFTVVPADQAESPAIDITFPDPTHYDVIVPLGARWPVYDEALKATWVGAQTELVRNAAAAGIPTLGVCFGGQLLAQAFGGTVERSALPEIGWYDIVSDQPELIPPGPWFEWHFDRFTLPPGAVEIARTATTLQAFALGRTVGLQFHPELDPQLLEIWLDDDRDAGEAGALGVSHDELRARTRDMHEDAARRLHALVNGFLAYTARQPCPSS
ncbi:type 1 glutamine amidotransferase [Mycolicibacterium neoaurum]|uniref:type 1 glutamine amidotransferase n=1 Tax=Mycolicibacterium neoaurum TaxID=1795 RepID=UPI00248B311D|nr:type 1 glutamine amidotransferase [Mycolicibacterium neoaurum]WBP93776.1 type 1 glutamine amidotransferase [Mycolicibacterium neoaurum]WBS07569.1 type 1 glutamine amidotransferase [Mycolicibacterium neoaurum]